MGLAKPFLLSQPPQQGITTLIKVGTVYKFPLVPVALLSRCTDNQTRAPKQLAIHSTSLSVYSIHVGNHDCCPGLLSVCIFHVCVCVRGRERMGDIVASVYPCVCVCVRGCVCVCVKMFVYIDKGFKVHMGV